MQCLAKLDGLTGRMDTPLCGPLGERKLMLNSFSIDAVGPEYAPAHAYLSTGFYEYTNCLFTLLY